MASISRESEGRKTIQFVAKDGTRKSLRLGKVAMRIAESVKVKVEDLVGATMHGHAPRDDTSRWIAELDDVMANRLASVGLVPAREAARIGPWLDR